MPWSETERQKIMIGQLWSHWCGITQLKCIQLVLNHCRIEQYNKLIHWSTSRTESLGFSSQYAGIFISNQSEWVLIKDQKFIKIQEKECIVMSINMLEFFSYQNNHVIWDCLFSSPWLVSLAANPGASQTESFHKPQYSATVNRFNTTCIWILTTTFNISDNILCRRIYMKITKRKKILIYCHMTKIPHTGDTNSLNRCG